MRFILAALIAMMASPSQSASSSLTDCRDDRVDLRGPWGQAGFSVEVAVTHRARAKGLMFREDLPLGQGMLFVYPMAHEPSFWMKNTLIPLDIIYLTSDGRVSYIYKNAQPGDLTPVSGGDEVRYVLEINGGLAKRIGISVGSELRSPYVQQQIAVWPCAPMVAPE
ncbi:DUF192 domain-containing protein [Aliiroseovarius sp. KMU-50]|uniref:DUF192 domain-containing protein n=1 Tax=Aliiroseovarius salicola TaxID=3009082 RepID=A0ABT4W254_9RHOB|nr:DUF192 domain-containing protein [Aliiroseovarius sp. KMU-50]MDA5094590.1 DUF192 domain-containing protein [Aliiroseovarius sp. KMU-50]